MFIKSKNDYKDAILEAQGRSDTTVPEQIARRFHAPKYFPPTASPQARFYISLKNFKFQKMKIRHNDTILKLQSRSETTVLKQIAWRFDAPKCPAPTALPQDRLLQKWPIAESASHH